MSSTTIPSGGSQGPSDARIFTIAPVRFVMPEGYLPDPYFVFEGRDTKLLVTAYVETQEADAAAILARRFKDLEDAGLGFELERQEAVKAGVRRAQVMVVSNGHGEAKFTICLCLVAMERDRFWEIRYEFKGEKTGSTQEFDRIVTSLRFPGDPPSPVPLKIPENQQNVKLFGLQALLPKSFRRTTAYTFENAGAGISWAVDAAFLSLEGLTVQPEPDTPMIKEIRRQSVTLGLAKGSTQLLRATNPETGRPGDWIVRANVVIAERAQVILRGKTAGATSAKLETDLEFILQNIVLEKES